MTLTELDSKYVSRPQVKALLAKLDTSKTYIKQLGGSLGRLKDYSSNVYGALKILKFFRIPGSDRVKYMMDNINDEAKLAQNVLNNIDMTTVTHDLREMMFKLDSLYEYIKDLEEKNDNAISDRSTVVDNYERQIKSLVALHQKEIAKLKK